jgi:hypothetical protein
MERVKAVTEIDPKQVCGKTKKMELAQFRLAYRVGTTLQGLWLRFQGPVSQTSTCSAKSFHT